MAGDPIPMEYRVKQVYTLSEAVDLMKMYDRYPTGRQFRWKNVHTGKEVVIGYND